MSEPILGPANDWAEDCMHWWGRILAGTHSHWCYDWDELPIDDTCISEMACCHCYDKE
jgi:hypothetical protein